MGSFAGMYVRAMIEEGVRDSAILVPQQAVSRDPKGNPVALIVDNKDTVQQRELVTDRSMGDKWLVSSGLVKGDRVIVEGSRKRGEPHRQGRSDPRRR